MKRRLFVLAALTGLVVLILIRALDPLAVRAARNTYFDGLQTLSPRAIEPLPVRVVDIDEGSLAEYGQWPWPRDRLADLVQKLWDAGAATVVFDVLFAEPDRMSPDRILSELRRRGAAGAVVGSEAIAKLDNDAIFADEMAQTQVVLGTALVAGSGTGVVTPKAGFVQIGDSPAAGLPQAGATTPILPPLATAATGIGMLSVSPLGDLATVRTVPLVWNTDQGLMPSLAVEALRVALGASTLILQGADGAPGLVTGLKIGDFTVPTTPDGQIWVRYRRFDPSLYIPARDVLSGTLSPEAAAGLQGAIVFVGTSAAGLLDIRTTALGQTVPGVSIHAQIVEQILTGSYLERNGLVGLGEVLALFFVGALVIFAFAFAGPVAAISAGAVSATAMLGASWLLFTRQGILFDATYPLGAGLVMFSAMTAYQFIVADREKRQIRRSFSHYVSHDVLREIESSGHNLELGGHSRPATVMFADIRNFTPMSEGMDAASLVSMLNSLFTTLGEEILGQRGTIDKFIGDAVMAFWNAPVDQPDHAARALLAALGMRRALERFNRGSGRPQVALAIGIASGTVLVGNIGSRDRFNYSLVGDAVNRAARIETACRHVDYDILTTREAAESSSGIASLFAGYLDLKGVSERLPVSIVLGGSEMAASEAFRELVEAHRALLEDLAAGGPEVLGRVESCLGLAREIEPGLERFYRRIGARAGDFAGA